MNDLSQINLGDRLRVNNYSFAEIRPNIEDNFLWRAKKGEAYFRTYYISSDYIIDSSYSSLYIFLNGNVLEVEKSWLRSIM